MTEQANRVALVIGNGAYQYARALSNPVSDAVGMATALRRLGFEVMAHFDLDIQEMDDKIDDFHARIVEGGVALFYFAGHALQVDGENYLVPVDARIAERKELTRRAFRLSEEVERMRVRAGASLIFLDACRDNPFVLAASPGDGFRSVVTEARGLAETAVPNGAFIAFATEPGRYARDGETGTNSPFTAALLQYIETPGISIQDVMMQVKRTVLAATNRFQRPWEQSSLTEDFYFKPEAAPAAPVRADPVPGPGPAVSADSAMRPHDAAWGQLQQAHRKERGNAQVIERFLSDYPNSPHVGEAQHWLLSLHARAAVGERDTAAAFKGGEPSVRRHWVIAATLVMAVPAAALALGWTGKLPDLACRSFNVACPAPTATQPPAAGEVSAADQLAARVLMMNSTNAEERVSTTNAVMATL